MKSAIGMLAGAVLAAAAGAAFAEVNVGDKAPALDIKEWIQGDPVVIEQGAGKTIYVVEFWATWCGPCKTSIPHLSKLAERFKGQVVFVGVSDEEPETIREFAKDGKFKYAVAADNNRNTYGGYMPEKSGIPHAYVVDRQGNIAWDGHPMSGLDAVLEKLVVGKWDVAKYKQAAELRGEMIRQINTQDTDKILPAADAVLAVAPDDETAMNVKYQCYVKKEDSAAWRTFVQGHYSKIEGDWRALNALAWRLVTLDGLEWREPAVAVKAAKKAVELTASKESDALDTLARAYFETGLLDLAIDTQKKAIALDDKNEAAKKVLAYYTACAEVRKTAAPPSTKKK
jgi:thiol-disulfide isomerase/thioredoxin